MTRPHALLAACTAFLGFSAAPSPAAPADSFYYEFCSGAVLRMTPTEDRDRSYRLDLRNGTGWTRYGKVVLDNDGRFLARQVDGRGSTQYTPHNCEKVPGICEYTERLPDGRTLNKARINGREGETWTHSIFETRDGKRELLVIGTVRYHEDGLAAEETWINTGSASLAEGCAKRRPTLP
ncbi:MAG: hypothetical protein AAGG06_02460 [Pseudomonadota bacterium]